jgi:hypothetical protein
MTLSTFIIVICLIVSVWSLFVLYRNQRIHDVRVSFIYAADFPRSYEALPTYDSMLYRPQYWSMWTVQDWKDWIAKEPK